MKEITVYIGTIVSVFNYLEKALLISIFSLSGEAE
ncbi:hypothetical protein MGA3_04700 [Bacillus methanolicus MGA3]|nr:hypothetical protein MGA3_04700 [Bacillus methanolicus MGA3]